MHTGQGWTLVHSHFLQMGGFKLHCTTKEKDDYIPSLGYLSDNRLYQSKGNGKNPCDFCTRARAMDSDHDSQLTAVPPDGTNGDSCNNGGASVCISPTNGCTLPDGPGQTSDGPCNYCECIWEGTLTASVLFKVTDAGIIDFPTLSKAEINDRSKSDLLNKAIASMQITWFIIQVIARLIQGLSISQLELTTTALAVINVTMYFFWLQKPFDVHYPVVIQTHSVEQLLAHRLRNGIYNKTEAVNEPWLSQLLHVIQDVARGIFKLVAQKFLIAHETSRDAHWRRCDYIISLGQSKVWRIGRIANFTTSSTSAAQMSVPFLNGRTTLMVPADGGPSVLRDYEDLTESIHSDFICASSIGTSDVTHAMSEMGEISQRLVSVEQATQDSEFLPFRRGTMTLALFQRSLYYGSLLIMQIAIYIKLLAFLVQSLVLILGITPLSVIIRPKSLLDIDEDAFTQVRWSPLLDILVNTKLRMALFAPILYSETNSRAGNTYVFGTIAGSVFAAIHVSAIWLPFPSVFEKWLWEAWSLLLSVTCISFVFLGIWAKYSIDGQRDIWILIRQNNRGWAGGHGAVLEDYDKWTLDYSNNERFQWQGMGAGERIALVFLFLFLTSYGLIRFGLLVMAVTLLRELPRSALVKIAWSDLLPHI